MPPDPYRFYIRKFLNRPGYHAGAYVLATVAEHSNTGRLTISDCDRIVRLEFSGYGAADRRNSIHKADVLITAVSGLRDALAHPQSR